MMTAISYGEILWDIIQNKEYLGGAPLNFAAHFVKCGGKAGIISRLGADARGAKALNEIRSLGVDDSGITESIEEPTGTVLVTLNNGEPDYIINKNVAYDNISFDRSYSNLSSRFAMLYFGSVVQRGTPSSKTLYQIIEQNNFSHIFYDVNLRKSCYSLRILERSLAVCSIFKLNLDEVNIISEMLFGDKMTTESFCQSTARRFSNISIVIITAAEKGCFIFSGTNLKHIPGTPVSVCDAVGAGDAFSAAFMRVFMHNHNPESAAAIANIVGAYVAGNPGPIPVYSAEIKRLIRG